VCVQFRYLRLKTAAQWQNPTLLRRNMLFFGSRHRDCASVLQTHIPKFCAQTYISVSSIFWQQERMANSLGKILFFTFLVCDLKVTWATVAHSFQLWQWSNCWRRVAWLCQQMPASLWSEDCFYYCLEKNHKVVLFRTLKVQSFILIEVSGCGLLIVVTSSIFLKRKDMLKGKSN